MILLTGAGQPINGTAGLQIKGYVMDALRPSTPVSGVTVTMSGGASGSTTTDANGYYQFTGIVPTGNIVLTCTKPITPALTTGNYVAYFAALGINSSDVSLANSIAGGATPTSNFQRIAANTNGNSALNSSDVTALSGALSGNSSDISTYNFTAIRRFFPTTYTPPTNNTIPAATETITVTATTGIVTASWVMTTKGDVVI